MADGGTRVDNTKQCGVSCVVLSLDSDGAIDDAVNPGAGMILAVDLLACPVCGAGFALREGICVRSGHGRSLGR